MSKIIVVFGASGIIGQGFIKATLEKGIARCSTILLPQSSLQNLIYGNFDAAGIKVVGIFRSEESAKKIFARLGNPAEDKFVSIIGNVGKF